MVWPTMLTLLDVFSDTWQKFAEWGLLGVFILSIVGNAVPYSTIPYLFVVVALTKVYHPLILGVVSGIGSAIGKLVIYGFGLGIRKVISDKQLKKFERFVNEWRRGTFLLIFLFAATPSPDDVIYVPVATARYPLWKFFTAVALGKVVLTVFIAYWGMGVLAVVESMELPWYVSAMLLGTASIYVLYVSLRIDWDGLIMVCRRSISRCCRDFILELAMAMTLVKEFVPESGQESNLDADLDYGCCAEKPDKVST